MRLKSVCVLVLLCLLWPAKASADNRFIVRTTLDLETLQTCAILPYYLPGSKISATRVYGFSPTDSPGSLLISK